MSDRPPDAKGRGAPVSPTNRFERIVTEWDLEHVESDEEYLDGLAHPETVYLDDDTQSVVSTNNSPDINFTYSLNPYRGCLHGCSYCYARPYHEYLGFNAGLDFETKIVAKRKAPALFRDFLADPKWVPETIVLSGITDPYQPCERQFAITRGCLEVALEARQPLGIITKNALITRDLDLLSEMARLRLVHVGISITTLDAELARQMEPRTSAPHARLRAIRELSSAGVPVRAMTAPMVPGLNDSELPKLLEAVAEAGAKSAGYTMLRLPYAVAPIFMAWLEKHRPLAKAKVENAIRATRDGALNNSVFSQRMRGTGLVADQIAKMFAVFVKKFGLDQKSLPNDVSQFRPPQPTTGQRRLF